MTELVLPSYTSGGGSPLGRKPRRGQISLVVLHVNVGPEVTGGAYSLGRYLQGPIPPDYPAYHSIHDAADHVIGARDDEQVNGAGGVNPIALHECFIGYADQSAAQWNDAYSRAELVAGAPLVRAWCERYSLEKRRLTPAEIRRGARGICGHVDVSAVYGTSKGHYDPGPNFPWADFLALVNAGVPTAAQIAAYFALLEEIDVEHGMAVDFVLDPSNPARGYTLDRWGGVHAFGGAPPAQGATGYWPHKDVARRIQVIDWSKPAGYVMDHLGALHPFGGAPRIPKPDPPYWPSGKIVTFNEV